jgi:hypothetical protein
MNYYVKVKEVNNRVIDYIISETPPLIEEGFFYVCEKVNFYPPLSESVWVYQGNHRFKVEFIKQEYALKTDSYTYTEFINIITTKNLLESLQEEKKEILDYYIYKLSFSDENKTIFCCIDSENDADSVNDYELNYQSKANKPYAKKVEIDSLANLSVESSTGWLRTRARQVSGDLKGKFVYFTTGDANSLDAGGDSSYSIAVENGKTYIDFFPACSYEIAGGSVRLLTSSESMSGKSCKLAFILAPDIPVESGGVGHL